MNKYEKKGLLFTSIWDGFPKRPIIIGDRYSRWRKIAKAKGLSKEATKRLDWIIYYYTTAKEGSVKILCVKYSLAGSYYLSL
ncbi:MAG: hypothetical protein ACOX0G_02370 [Patescibacteria group bacterium]|jgi:hypothetical protein